MSLFKLIVASLSTVFLFLAIWKNSYFYNCFVMVIPFVMLSIIASTFMELKIEERNCFKNCYFIANSIFAKVLSSRFLLIIFYLIASVVMTSSALYSVLDFSKTMWIYLIFHISIIVVIYKFINYLLRNTIKSKYCTLIAREWSVNITSVMMILVYIYISIYSYEPSYLRMTFLENYQAASNSLGSNCLIINYVLKLQIEIDSMFWWLMDQSNTLIQDKDYKLFVWIGFLFMNSLTILGLNRFIAQVIYLIDKVFNADKRRENE